MEILTELGEQDEKEKDKEEREVEEEASAVEDTMPRQRKRSRQLDEGPSSTRSSNGTVMATTALREVGAEAMEGGGEGVVSEEGKQERGGEEGVVRIGQPAGQGPAEPERESGRHVVVVTSVAAASTSDTSPSDGSSSMGSFN